MHKLESAIQHYAWGSREAIARLRGRAVPSAKPEAELWMGAHPAAPSSVPDLGITLPELVARDPDRVLGADVRARFAGGFPFLLKLLAAEEPLSIQAHPSKAQAEAGFADEEARGVARDAPHRNYKDSNHKPELLCALTPVEALCGFRAVADTVALLDELGIGELAKQRELLAAAATGKAMPATALRETFRDVMSRPPAARESLLAETKAACVRGTSARFRTTAEWTLRLAERYPGDVGAVSALLLNHIVLAPGEAIFLPAGNLHAYLRGFGVEIMASSDNVLRGGLTSKHVDVPELLRVLDFSDGPAHALTPIAERPEQVYRTPAPDFRLSRIDVAGDVALSARSAEILLCTEGHVTAHAQSGDVALTPGESALVLAADRDYRLTGRGVVFRATVGL